MGHGKFDCTRFKDAIAESWDALDQGMTGGIIDSMPRCLGNVIRAVGLGYEILV